MEIQAYGPTDAEPVVFTPVVQVFFTLLIFLIGVDALTGFRHTDDP
jgi:hypothetical protein